jgi:hypothetical protein
MIFNNKIRLMDLNKRKLCLIKVKKLSRKIINKDIFL